MEDIQTFAIGDFSATGAPATGTRRLYKQMPQKKAQNTPELASFELFDP
jgi:hypothetical protein